MKDTWIVSPSPHLRSSESTPHIMWQVVAALAPAGLWALIQFGLAVLWVIGVSVGACVVVEALLQRWRGVPVSINDGSAVVTGVLLAYVLPAHVVAGGEIKMLPWYVPVVGATVAIAIAKQAFGGLGHNIWNPALVGRAFVQVSFPAAVSLKVWAAPHYAAQGLPVDAIAAATPLATRAGAYKVADLFFGLTPGSMGEISALLLLLGGVYLMARNYVDWRLPLCYLGAVMLFAAFLPVKAGSTQDGAAWAHEVLYQVFAGGVMLGALFMATDMVTSPLTSRGQAIYGLGCGMLTVLIRFYTHYPEGVCYAILLMNTVRPLIDRHTRPRVFGERTRRPAT